MTTASQSSAVARLLKESRGDGLILPPPGSGDTLARWIRLREWGQGDLSFAKLAESHTDALAILHEAGRAPTADVAYGVWASSSGGTGLQAKRDDADGWYLSGRLRFASGAGSIQRSLVTARSESGTLLFDVGVLRPEWNVVPGSWPTVGMAGTQSVDVEVDQFHVGQDALVGEVDWYTGRPGFWLGAIGVAAVWIGALDALTSTFANALGQREGDAHQLAHLGAVVAGQSSAAALLTQTAQRVDVEPGESWHGPALEIRCLVEAMIDDTLTRLGRAMGPTLVVRDPEHAQRVADISVFVRQSHAERDLAELGRLVAAAGDADDH